MGEVTVRGACTMLVCLACAPAPNAGGASPPSSTDTPADAPGIPDRDQPSADPDGDAGPSFPDGGDGLEPTIDAVVPASVVLGGSVRIEGAGFDRYSFVMLGDHTLATSFVAEGTLEAAVPADLVLATCRDSFELRVGTDELVSAAVPLEVKQPAPQVTADDFSVPAGETIVLRVDPAGPAEVRIAGEAVPALASGDSALTITVPAAQTPGVAELVISTDCGDARLALSILPPLAQVLDLNPRSLAEGGVTFVRSDLINRDELVGIRVGSTLIDARDPQFVSWPPIDDPGLVGVFGVRMPEGLAPGPVQLALELATGISRGVDIEVVPVPSFVPPTPRGISFPPTRAANDGAFPISTSQPFMLVPSDDDNFTNWFYDLFFSLERDETSDTCVGGLVEGYECYIAEPHDTPPNDCFVDDMTRFALVGTYVFNADANVIDLTIDRGTNGGVERYIGGWIGSAVSQSSLALDSGAYILLVSQRTGLQLRIAHGITEQRICD